MFRTCIAASVSIWLAQAIPAADSNAGVALTPTHQLTKVIKIADGGNSQQLNAFCLNHEEQIVAICGRGPGEVRVVNDNGEILQSWPTSVRPESVAVNDNGEILIGGGGMLFRFDAAGKELQQAKAPHAISVRTDMKQLRKVATRQLTARGSRSPIASRIAVYERVLAELEAKGKKTELNEQEMRVLEMIPKKLERFREQAEEEAQKSGQTTAPTEEQIQIYIERLVQSSMKISSISASGKYVFIATLSPVGFGFDVWRTDRDFSSGRKIITGLRGCCGQMDVQCCGNEVFVAENSRHRVVRYDPDGREQAKWGSRNRIGIDGFSSCCNPMNLCFSSDGDLFTAESTTGRIKRFHPDGDLVSFVGEVDLLPGCKNVSIASSTDDKKVYVLDLSRNQIVLLQPEQSAK